MSDHAWFGIKKKQPTKPNKTSYIGRILESLRNAFFWRRNWLFSEPVQHTAVTTVCLNATDFIHSVAKCSSEVQGYMTWKTSDHWGVGMHLWSKFWIPVFNFLNSMAEVWKLLGSFFAPCKVSLNYSGNKGWWTLDSSTFLNHIINYLMIEVGTWVHPTAYKFIFRISHLQRWQSTCQVFLGLSSDNHLLEHS